ncbi:ATP-dependent nuclease [Acinetobacter nosocomialis]|uniref:ATP-dependent nuclease n=1 Tax=Acinetobacter nosocomialis TaxID=106654 RepID=UPI0020123C55|nr:AAA family ATPase [Acinetobacter nosocomialis]
MNTSNIKKYAPQARNDFIAAMRKQSAKYGITADRTLPTEQKGDLLLIGDQVFPLSVMKPREKLIKRIQTSSFEQTIDYIAYSWFNRLCAIRYMECKGLLDHGRRVLSSADGSAGLPQILEECLDIDLPGLDASRVAELKLDGNKDEELYRELLLAQCHALNQVQYWSANQNLNIEFKIDKKTATVKRQVNTSYGSATTVDTNIVEHVLDIRVKNSKTRVSLPLQNRSKGFNWFFSFLVWFNKIQADSNSKYILLLDEPGLNLHATAQADLLRFLESLVDKYQVIYTTHSPFMVETTKLNRVRTVFSDSDSSIVSDSIQQKDPNTLFPLQAALGYDVAQNLFISKKNLLVEGVSDLLYLTTISEYLNANKRTGLNEDITIVPTGGLDKVASFISLLRGSKLSIFCLLDSFTDQKSQARFDSLTIQKIISDKNIKFFHDFLDNRKKADIEDIFTIDEYLQLFNISLSSTHAEIKVEELSTEIEDILSKINKVIKKNRFNHYLPAKEFASNKDFVNSLSEATLSRFETIFKEVNKNLK